MVNKTIMNLIKNVFFIIFIIAVSCNEKIDHSSEIENRLKIFYNEYIKELDNMPINQKKIDLIKQLYITDSLLAMIEQEHLDYDPLLKAQDVNTEMLNTLKILKIERLKYSICYFSSYKNNEICIIVSVLKTDKGYKINNIFNDFEDTKELQTKNINSNPYTGRWKWKKNDSTTVFSLNIRQEKNKLIGNYCGTFFSGAKIDCIMHDSSFIVDVETDSSFITIFKSDYSSNKLGKVKLTLLKSKELFWQIIEKPQGEFYAPEEAFLKIE